MDFLHLKITRRQPIAADAILLYFEETGGRKVAYEAGQFFTFIINFNGREVRRSYSIFTTPGIDAELGIVIRRRENGEISRYLIDHVTPGSVLTALPPSGRFTISGSGRVESLFFIVAGSGIGPVFSLLKKVLYQALANSVLLIYQNRDEAGIIFNKELQDLQEIFPSRLNIIHLLSSPLNRHVIPQRLNNYLLENLINLHNPATGSSAFYICGPGSFMRMAQFVLKLMGFKDEQIRRENFVIDAIPIPPLAVDASIKHVSLRWKGQVYNFTTAYPVNILQAALNNNIHLPYSCRGGRCSTCTVKCISGKVHMTINDVLTDRDLANGWVLTCVGYADTDLELEVS